MLFDVQAALIEILSEAHGRSDFRDTCDIDRPESQKSRESQSQPDDDPALAKGLLFENLPAAPTAAAPQARDNRGHSNRSQGEAAQPSTPELARQEDARPGAGGYHLTWTGRVVRLDEWRQLGSWERHGPEGRLFCGICCAWVSTDGRCGQVRCWKIGGGVA